LQEIRDGKGRFAAIATRGGNGNDQVAESEMGPGGGFHGLVHAAMEYRFTCQPPSSLNSLSAEDRIRHLQRQFCFMSRHKSSQMMTATAEIERSELSVFDCLETCGRSVRNPFSPTSTVRTLIGTTAAGSDTDK
jgi:hypothetical protein